MFGVEALLERGHNVTLVSFVPDAGGIVGTDVKLINLLPIFEEKWPRLSKLAVGEMLDIT